ncbi:hypothetical protein CFR71_11930 [Novacetimonas pomaceti]|uniref:Uncharacterized protein n=2 Tax=Novacetimonas pomaceti TaxID=2021998 RepID=A0A318QAW6_9PROT|nr:hypothetical protein CFR71_11930 [Novacetimonas pomaceti]
MWDGGLGMCDPDFLCGDHPRWAVRYVAQLWARLARLAEMRAELSAARFEGAYDGADLIGYLDDECDTVRATLAGVGAEITQRQHEEAEDRAATAADAARDGR